MSSRAEPSRHRIQSDLGGYQHDFRSAQPPNQAGPERLGLASELLTSLIQHPSGRPVGSERSNQFGVYEELTTAKTLSIQQHLGRPLLGTLHTHKEFKSYSIQLTDRPARNSRIEIEIEIEIRTGPAFAVPEVD